MIKVVQICTSSSSGGAALIAQKIHQGLEKAEDFESEFLSRASNSSLRTILSVANFRLQGRDSFFLDELYWEKLLREKFFSDKIVHFHNLHGYFLPFNLVEEISTQAIKVIITLHDKWWATGRCAYPPESCNEHKNNCKACPSLNIYPKTLLKRDFSKQYAIKREFLKKTQVSLTAPSLAMVADLQSRLDFNYPIETVYNGVEVKSNGIEKLKDTLVSGLDNFSHHKGSDLALKMLSQASKEDEFDVLIKDERALRYLVKDYSCKINFIKAPRLHTDFCRLLESYRYIVIPSRFETFGLLPLEASILGTRPILLNLDVFNEILGDYPIYANDFYTSWKTRVPSDEKFSLKEVFNIDVMLDHYMKIYKRSSNA